MKGRGQAFIHRQIVKYVPKLLHGLPRQLVVDVYCEFNPPPTIIICPITDSVLNCWHLLKVFGQFCKRSIIHRNT